MVGLYAHYCTCNSERGPSACLSRPQCYQHILPGSCRPKTILNRRFSQYRWTKIREKLGLGDVKFHDLRKTFGSVLAQNGVSTAVVQRLLEHSSPDLTNKVYTNVDPVL
ncbi:MAG: tyrosine-type recombinase/integrase, partial [Desulfobacteraceae bacterium]|nr:tyrosine-type recombinase/integrase [Desulfobacteraceae bacterium]